jgi:hypothetical protein
MPVAQFLIRGWNWLARFMAQFFDAVGPAGRKRRKSGKSRPD